MVRMSNLVNELIREEVNSQLPEETLDESALPTLKDGQISKDDLFKHADINGDGKVDLVDFAALVLFHVENPQYLRQYMDAARERIVDSNRAEYVAPPDHQGNANPVGRRNY